MPILDPNYDTRYHQLPDQNPPKKLKIDLLLLANILIVILPAYLLTLRLFLIESKMSLDENLRLHLSGSVSLHSSSLRNDHFNNGYCKTLE